MEGIRLIIRQYFPFLVNIWKHIKSFFRSIRRKIRKYKYGIIQKEDLKSFFNQMGIRSGDVLFVHSSLNAMGIVEGGPSTVIEVLQESIGENGTLVMPSFPATGKSATYVAKHRTFDLRNTPSATGVITEEFRKRSGVFRSAHLTDSVCAWGKHAQWITAEHHVCLRPHEKNSPFGRFIQLKGKILLIGVNLETVTLLHASEDAMEDFPYPVYLPDPVEYEIFYPDSSCIRARTLVHNPEQSSKRKCNDLWKHFVKEGFASEHVFRGCTYRIIEASPMHEWLIRAFKEKHISMYHPDGIK